MLGKPPPSLGDTGHVEYALSRFEVPLPESRKEKVAAFETLLNQGGVQKLVFEIGRPIQVTKLVNKDELSTAPPEAPADDLWKQVRNSRMEELLHKPVGEDPCRTLLHAFSDLADYKLKPLMLFCHDHVQLKKWLQLPEKWNVDTLYGVETSPQPDIPEDAVILVGISFDENYESLLGMRIPVDIPKPKRAFDPTHLEAPPGPPDPPKPPPGRKYA
jgi:hypothetical protein